MFDKLKKAFSNAAKSIGQKEITEKILDDTLLDLQIALLESDVAQEVVDSLSARLKKELLGLKLEKGQDPQQVIQAKLQASVAGIFARAGRLDLVQKIKAKKEAKAGPFVIVFLGINGTGKTTTVAKFANLLRKSGITVVAAAGDTHRAGAIEQLSQHGERLSLKVIAQRYGADPSAVGRDAVDYARKHRVDAVLIDTAGRMQTSKNLMDEMSKIVRVVRPDAKLFVGDALAGNDTINQAREFHQYASFDGAILTKIDADAKGGAAISIAHITSKPITYVGVGQGYDDIIPFDPDKFIESLFGSAAGVSVKDLMTELPPPSPAGGLGEEPAAEVQEKEQEKEEPLPPRQPAATAVATPSAAPSAPAVFTTPAAPEKTEPVKEEQEKKPAAVNAPPPPSTHQPLPPSPVAEQPITAETEEKPKEEKKSRFGGLFGRKGKGDDDRQKKEEEEKEKEKEKEKRRRQQEEAEERERREKDEEEERRRKEAEKKEKEKEKKEKEKRKEDKDKDGQQQEEDKVIYLTDDDIEDLLK